MIKGLLQAILFTALAVAVLTAGLILGVLLVPVFFGALLFIAAKVYKWMDTDYPLDEASGLGPDKQPQE